jgi:RNA polymerase sigma-70 factor (ECF subfamily)
MAGPKARDRRNMADEALIRSLFNEHGKAMLGYATRLTNDRAAAEDVVQEAMLRAWRSPDSLINSKGSVRGWLLTVIRNIVIDRARAREVRPMEVAETPTTVPVEHDHADRVVDSIVVLDALEHLSAEHRDVLVQLYLHGRTVRETAEMLGIPSGTVKSRSYYALRALRDLFPVPPSGVQGAA